MAAYTGGLFFVERKEENEEKDCANARPSGGVHFFCCAKRNRRKNRRLRELGRPVIGGENLITARSFRNRVLLLRSSAIPNEALPMRAVSF
ncbi:hypothetical protein SYK_26980 [Pseudodesulfovibrio nedwellii]|uniref:Uncharacterized protein n=1 Tax=Pseudodesulfovibrio nedwellii TaxID=2973072 RepID=A0ABM8B3K7_9BACT|nr:hypothetical protein [Pseudodesulfovibrio nedwellii]BDQ38338.1 hypothetical protein SYK_26980 [Pseudodesulfovibrio nedwellii]